MGGTDTRNNIGPNERLNSFTSLGTNTNKLALTRRRTILIEGSDQNTQDNHEKKTNKCCKKFNSCIESILGGLSSIPDCLVRVSAFIFKGCFSCLAPRNEAEKEKIIDLEVDEEMNLEAEVKELLIRRESPEWPELCVIITETLSNALEKARSIMIQNKSTEMQMNISNLVGIISMIVEVYTYSSLAFTSEVG